MEDGSINLVITSPPYNMRLRIRNDKYTLREKSEHFSKKYSFFDDALPINDFYEFHKGVIKELLRVSSIVCYNFQIVTGSKEAFFKIIGDFSGNIKDIIIWDKGHGQPSMHKGVLNSTYEMILVLESDNKKGRQIQNAKFERGKMDNIIRIGRDRNESKINSAVFPEKLVGKLVESFSLKGDLVYDPFCGSGTVPVVCEKLGRNWIGSEIITEQYKESLLRVQHITNNLFK